MLANEALIQIQIKLLQGADQLQRWVLAIAEMAAIPSSGAQRIVCKT
jgi:hypothetical protein